MMARKRFYCNGTKNGSKGSTVNGTIQKVPQETELKRVKSPE